MTFEEVSEKAYKKEKLENTANLAEKYAYVYMTMLYKDYKQEKITKEQAEKEKTQIKNEFDVYQNEIKKYYDVFREYHENRIKFEEYVTAIEKSETQADIMDNSLKLIELIIQDKSFFNRTTERLQNND